MFHDPADFPFVSQIVARWHLIRQEALELEADLLDFQRVGSLEHQAETLLRHNGWTPSWQVGTRDRNASWLTYGLSYRGVLPDDLEARMPFTSRLLARLRGYEVCALSLLRPGAFIRPHTHPEVTGRLLTLHVGLDAEPSRSFLAVGGQVREECNGQAIVFDASQPHFALNMGSFDRTILYMEFSPNQTRFLD